MRVECKQFGEAHTTPWGCLSCGRSLPPLSTGPEQSCSSVYICTPAAVLIQLTPVAIKLKPAIHQLMSPEHKNQKAKHSRY